MSTAKDHKRLILIVGLLVLISAAFVVYRVIQDWFEFGFDMLAQDCLMNSWSVVGEVQDKMDHQYRMPTFR